MLIGHGGNIYDLAQRLDCDPFEIIDMSSNVNPLPPMPGLMNFLKKNIHTITALPEADAQSAAQAFALRYSLDSDQVIAGNGSTQFIFAIPQALKTRRALILGPTYADYADACNMHAVPYDYFTASESLDFQPDIAAVSRQVKAYDTVFICNPNNPTGALIPKADLLRLARSCPNTYFIVDESYLPFVKAADQLSMLGCGLDNVLVLNSMSKIFRIPGLRIGFLISSHRVIEKFRPFLLPWNVNSLAQAAVNYLMQHTAEVDAFINATEMFLDTEKQRFAESFAGTSAIKLFPAKTSFILARLCGKINSGYICNRLSQDRILIRDCTNFRGLSDRFIRISLKTSEKNRMLAEKINKILATV